MPCVKGILRLTFNTSSAVTANWKISTSLLGPEGPLLRRWTIFQANKQLTGPVESVNQKYKTWRKKLLFPKLLDPFWGKHQKQDKIFHWHIFDNHLNHLHLRIPASTTQKEHDNIKQIKNCWLSKGQVSRLCLVSEYLLKWSLERFHMQMEMMWNWPPRKPVTKHNSCKTGLEIVDSSTHSNASIS